MRHPRSHRGRSRDSRASLASAREVDSRAPGAVPPQCRVRAGEEPPSSRGAETPFGVVLVIDGPLGPELGLCTHCGSLRDSLRQLIEALPANNSARAVLEGLHARVAGTNRALERRARAGRYDAVLDQQLQARYAEQLRAITARMPLPFAPHGPSQVPRVSPSLAELDAHRPLLANGPTGPGVPPPANPTAVEEEVWREYYVDYRRVEAELRVGTRTGGPGTWESCLELREGPVRGAQLERRVRPMLEASHPGEVVHHDVVMQEVGGSQTRRPDTLVLPAVAPTRGPILGARVFQRSHVFTAGNVGSLIQSDVDEAVRAHAQPMTIQRSETGRGAHPASSRPPTRSAPRGP